MVSIRKKPDAAMLLTHAPAPIHLIASLVATRRYRPTGGPAGDQ
jgi:hypothetical protein